MTTRVSPIVVFVDKPRRKNKHRKRIPFDPATDRICVGATEPQPRQPQRASSSSPPVTLRSLGYKNTLPVSERKQILRKAIRVIGRDTVASSLRFSSNTMRNRSPATSERLRADMDWVLRQRG